MTKRPSSVSRRAFVGATLATTFALGKAKAFTPSIASLTEFGGIGDDLTDNAEALRRALAGVGPNGALFVPPGNFRVFDDSFAKGGAPLALPVGITIIGEPGRSILRFTRRNLQSFYGLAILSDGITLRGLDLRCESLLDGWTAAVAITANSRNLKMQQVRFVGVGRRTGHYGILPIGADIENLAVEHCHFERLDFGFSRQTSDTSDCRNLSFTDCTGVDCTEVIEVNAPGLLLVETSAGSSVVRQIFDADGGKIAPSRLKMGQVVRCSAFPAGTRVAGVTATGLLQLSESARFTTRPDKPARLSAGSASHGKIDNLSVSNIGQWAVGLAHCDDWDISVNGINVGYELVHIEDGSRHILVKVEGANCNMKPGVVGSPGAENGMVHISTGSQDVAVIFDNVDLRRSAGPKAVGLCVQPGGLMGTTGREIAPTGIRVSGKIISCETSMVAVAFESELRFEGLQIVTPEQAGRSKPQMRLAGCKVGGTVRMSDSDQLLVQPESNRPKGVIRVLPLN